MPFVAQKRRVLKLSILSRRSPADQKDSGYEIYSRMVLRLKISNWSTSYQLEFLKSLIALRLFLMECLPTNSISEVDFTMQVAFLKLYIYIYIYIVNF